MLLQAPGQSRQTAVTMEVYSETRRTKVANGRAWTGHSAIFITWDEGSYADTSPFGPLDNRGGPDSPILPATPPDPTTGNGGDLSVAPSTEAVISR
jgi:hypothetical protein